MPFLLTSQPADEPDQPAYNQAEQKTGYDRKVESRMLAFIAHVSRQTTEPGNRRRNDPHQSDSSNEQPDDQKGPTKPRVVSHRFVAFKDQESLVRRGYLDRLPVGKGSNIILNDEFITREIDPPRFAAGRRLFLQDLNSIGRSSAGLDRGAPQFAFFDDETE